MVLRGRGWLATGMRVIPDEDGNHRLVPIDPGAPIEMTSPLDDHQIVQHEGTLDDRVDSDWWNHLALLVDKEEIERGQVLAKPGSITPHTKFEGEVYVLTKEEGGRHTPFFNGYRPQFYFRTTDVTGAIKLLGGAEMCMPGDNITMEIEVGKGIAMEEQSRFAVREGGRTVGSGVVTKILE